MKVLVAQSWPTLCEPRDYRLSGSSVHRILQARVVKWVAIPFSKGSSQPRDRTWVSCIAGGFFTIWATREAVLYKSKINKTISLILFILLFYCYLVFWMDKNFKCKKGQKSPFCLLWRNFHPVSQTSNFWLISYILLQNLFIHIEANSNMDKIIHTFI